MSLRTRVLIAMVLVAVLASVATAVVTRSQTIAAVEDAAAIDFENETTIRDQILEFGIVEGSWDGLDPLVDELAAALDTRIAVTRVDGRRVADSDPDGELPDVARGTLDTRFDFPTTGIVIGPDPYFEALSACFERRGIDVFAGEGVIGDELVERADSVVAGESFDAAEVIVGTDFVDLAELDLDDPELAAADECYEEVEADLVLSTPPVELYIGYPAEALIDLGSINTGQVLAASLGVLALALALAFLLAGRVSRPVGQLTTAVDLVGDGDLSQRVPLDGDGEFGRLGTAFNAMAERLERGERARSQMVSDIAHELRNPIGVLQGNLEAAQDGLFDVDATFIDTLHDETLHLAHLVEDLQQLALADAGALAVTRQPTDLAELIRGVVAGHRHAATDADITLTSEVQPLTASVDPNRIRQVVSNLVANAIAYTPNGGAVVVALEAEGAREEVVITVTDTGIGLSEDQRAMVFERFWRADESRHRHTGGRGLGLSVCHELVNAHGGSIDLTSTPGSGSTFVVRLPR